MDYFHTFVVFPRYLFHVSCLQVSSTTNDSYTSRYSIASFGMRIELTARVSYIQSARSIVDKFLSEDISFSKNGRGTYNIRTIVAENVR